MKKKQKKLYSQGKKRYLKKIVGTPEKPRFSVFRSRKHLYAQLIDDKNGLTLTSCSTLEKSLREQADFQKPRWRVNKQVASSVGYHLGVKAQAKGIFSSVFEKGKKAYHGRIQSVAVGARSAGLVF